MQTRPLIEALTDVRARIASAAGRGNRDPNAVTLVTVTKGHPPSAIEAALEAGLRDLGENRLGELQERVKQFPSGDIRWHMVGRLQRRKAPAVRGVAHLLHSLDSLKLAERLERTADPGEPPVRALIQVNVTGERAKTGFAPEELDEDMERLLELGTLRLEGLMTMAPFTEDEGVLRRTFRTLRQLNDSLRARFPEYLGEELSMGMSNDFEIAVEEGSTMVRIGTALLGERPE